MATRVSRLEQLASVAAAAASMSSVPVEAGVTGAAHLGMVLDANGVEAQTDVTAILMTLRQETLSHSGAHAPPPVPATYPLHLTRWAPKTLVTRTECMTDTSMRQGCFVTPPPTHAVGTCLSDRHDLNGSSHESNVLRDCPGGGGGQGGGNGKGDNDKRRRALLLLRPPKVRRHR
jgi:hypothetical protein